jgi:hypothetical protein
MQGRQLAELLQFSATKPDPVKVGLFSDVRQSLRLGWYLRTFLSSKFGVATKTDGLALSFAVKSSMVIGSLM